MIRFLLAAVAVTALVANSADARGRRSCCCNEAAPAAAPAPATPQPPTAPAQAQAPQGTRSFSYQPAETYVAPGTYVAPINGNYGMEGYYNVPADSWGLRPASAKANGNYATGFRY